MGTDQPTEPGHYWARKDGGAWRVVRYEGPAHGDGSPNEYPVSLVGSDDSFELDRFTGPWVRINPPEFPV